MSRNKGGSIRLGTTLSVIYPVDRSFKPSTVVLAELRRINGEGGRGLAEMLGFGYWRGTESEVVEGRRLWTGMGFREEDDIVVEHFSIFIRGALRSEDDAMTKWTPFVEEKVLKRLSEIVGTELAQKPFRW